MEVHREQVSNSTTATSTVWTYVVVFENDHYPDVVANRMNEWNPDSDRLVAEIREYFTDFGFFIRRDPKKSPSPTESEASPGGRAGRTNQRASAQFVRTRLVGEKGKEDLVVDMQASTGERFSVKLLRAFLSPARDPQTDSTFDLQHLIAEGVVFGMDETIRRFTAQELDGSTLSDFWTTLSLSGLTVGMDYNGLTAEGTNHPTKRDGAIRGELTADLSRDLP
jgi:hypothetical protein